MCLNIKICNISAQIKQISVILIVDRGSETQLQVGENLNKLT